MPGLVLNGFLTQKLGQVIVIALTAEESPQQIPHPEFAE